MMGWYKTLNEAKSLIELGKNDEAKEVLKEHLESLKTEVNLGQLITSLHNYAEFLEFAYNYSNNPDGMLKYLNHALDNLEYIQMSVNKLQKQF